MKLNPMASSSFATTLISILGSMEMIEDELAKLYGELSLKYEGLVGISLKLISEDSVKHRDVLRGIKDQLVKDLSESPAINVMLTYGDELRGKIGKVREVADAAKGGVIRDLARMLSELEGYESMMLNMYMYILEVYENASSKNLSSRDKARIETIKLIVRSIIDDERFHSDVIKALMGFSY